MWSGPEATSILSEGVAARKPQARLEGHEFPISTVTASQIEVERHELIERGRRARSVRFKSLALTASLVFRMIRLIMLLGISEVDSNRGFS